MKFDVLIVDDEKILADNTCEYFNMFDVKTVVRYDRESAEIFLAENKVSLILLDINLPDGSGFELCKEIRETTDIPILFISARNTDDDKMLALGIGGDDYIEKPYSLGVLLAKVKVVLKRYGSVISDDASDHVSEDDYDDGYLRVSFTQKQVFTYDEEKKLTSLEYRLLEYLIRNRNKLVTKAELFENVWKDKFTTDGTLNVHIRKLREAIEQDPKTPRYITTVWKEGYRFISQMDEPTR